MLQGVRVERDRTAIVLWFGDSDPPDLHGIFFFEGHFLSFFEVYLIIFFFSKGQSRCFFSKGHSLGRRGGSVGQ